MVASRLCVNGAESKLEQITKNNGAMELEAQISFRLDSKGLNLIVLSVTNKTSNILWIPRFSSSKNMVGCESIDWFKVDDEKSWMILHVDYGLCQFPRSYSKLLPNSSAEYLLDAKCRDEIKNKFKIEIWAPWRLKNFQRVDEKKKKEALGKTSVLIERVVGYGKIMP